MPEVDKEPGHGGEHERADSVGYISRPVDVEMLLNGSPIDWEYWASKMPRLTTEQAARLVCGLDPDVYTGNLKNSVHRDSGALRNAIRVERLAVAEGRTAETPEVWLSWAMNRGFEVPIGFEYWASGRNFSWEPLPEPNTKIAAAAMSEPQPVAKETPAARRARLLAMFEAEEKLGEHGALARLTKREGIDRSNTGRAIKKARKEREEQRRAGAWTSQIVRDGKRTD